MRIASPDGNRSAHSNGAAVVNATDFFGWGEAAPTGTNLELRTWSHDNFGEDLLINPRDSGIFYWDKTEGLTSRAVELKPQQQEPQAERKQVYRKWRNKF